jgi:ubiquinone/menaquinone biosynthesis C-methylase UbiE
MFRLEKFSSTPLSAAQRWDVKYQPEAVTEPDPAQYHSQDIWQLLQPHLQPEQRYLDVGCGVGGWLLFLRREGYTVEGVDITPDTIKRLKAFDSTLRVQVAGMTALPYADHSLDGVLAIGVLEYLEGRVDEAIREAARVLKPGGFVLIEVPIANWLRRLLYVPLKRLEKSIRQRQGKRAVFANYLFTHSELRRLLSQHGFTIQAAGPHDLPEADSHYGLYIDWPWLRGQRPYQLNPLGRIVKWICNAISPWMASTGMVLIARKNT